MKKLKNENFLKKLEEISWRRVGLEVPEGVKWSIEILSSMS
jgi:diphthamide synthase subunit DPH2